MSNSGNITPRIIKIFVIFIVVFFLLVIAFNIWMKSSLEKTGSVSMTTTVATKSEIKKPVSSREASMQKQQTPKTDTIQKILSTGTERRLLLQ